VRRSIRLGWRLLALSIWLFLGLLWLATGYRFLGQSARHVSTRVFAKGVLFFCGVSRQSTKGGAGFDASRPSSHPESSAASTDALTATTESDVPAGLVACNHISWIDIFVIQAHWPCIFIAKSEIRAWPLVGWLVTGSGTIFIERGNRRAIPGVIERAQRYFSEGERVAFFPEGTTSGGTGVLPFHASLFSMIETAPQTSLTLMAIRYKQRGRPTKATAYIDEMTLWESTVRIMSSEGLSVECLAMPFLTASDSPVTDDRRRLAKESREKIIQLLKA
jgi:1-acyl-sn-glycerol-3-phosphate acyltransferase